MFDVTRGSSIEEHHGVGVLGTDLVRSFPLNWWHIICILWRLFRVVIEGCVLGGELWVTEESILLSANLDDLLNLVLNGILLRLLLLHMVLVLIHLLAIVTLHVLTLLSRKHLLVLLLSDGHAIWTDELGVGIVLPGSHHLLLVQLLLVHILLLLLRSKMRDISELLTDHALSLHLHLKLLQFLFGHLVRVNIHLRHLHLHLLLHDLLIVKFLLLFFRQVFHWDTFLTLHHLTIVLLLHFFTFRGFHLTVFHLVHLILW